jgi:signal transduction histidine kinase
MDSQAERVSVWKWKFPPISRDCLPDAEVAIFRVLQESLTNVHRYAESPKAVVRMDVTADEIKLEIQDFGKGVKSSKSSSAAATPVRQQIPSPV